MDLTNFKKKKKKEISTQTQPTIISNIKYTIKTFNEIQEGQNIFKKALIEPLLDKAQTIDKAVDEIIKPSNEKPTKETIEQLIIQEKKLTEIKNIINLKFSDVGTEIIKQVVEPILEKINKFKEDNEAIIKAEEARLAEEAEKKRIEEARLAKEAEKKRLAEAAAQKAREKAVVKIKVNNELIQKYIVEIRKINEQRQQVEQEATAEQQAEQQPEQQPEQQAEQEAKEIMEKLNSTLSSELLNEKINSQNTLISKVEELLVQSVNLTLNFAEEIVKRVKIRDKKETLTTNEAKKIIENIENNINSIDISFLNEEKIQIEEINKKIEEIKQLLSTAIKTNKKHY